MSQLSEIEPQSKPNLIDLVKAAGVDVSDWSNCGTSASRNPKYCYRWAFVEPNKVVILNLWHGFMEEKSGSIVMRKVNMRQHADSINEPNKSRAIEFDNAIKTALKDKLPIRVIVGKEKVPGIYEIVGKRMLDPVSWTVAAYDWKTGQCTLMRGVLSKTNLKVKRESAVDDLSDVPEGTQFPDRAKIVAQVIKRDNRMRSFVIRRAKGKCEYCKVQGFPTSNGGFYLEAHHIISLGDSGRDTVDNVIALCPQHHRQAHYGIDAESLETKFTSILKELNRK
jgi:5-methylcytosine-specific restriction protein A